MIKICYSNVHCLLNLRLLRAFDFISLLHAVLSAN